MTHIHTPPHARASAQPPDVVTTARRRATPSAVILYAALLCAALLSACGSPDPWERAAPDEALRAFLAALAYHDLQSAWEFLDPNDRAALTAHADALQKLPGHVTRDPWLLLNPGHIPASGAEIKAVEVIDRPDATSATVRVSLHDGRSFSVSMRRADGRWLIDLPLSDHPHAQTPPTPERTP
jgi:hypothetical protein